MTYLDAKEIPLNLIVYAYELRKTDALLYSILFYSTYYMHIIFYYNLRIFRIKYIRLNSISLCNSFCVI